MSTVQPQISDSRIVDALDAGVLVVRADGRIVRANPCAARILGRAAADLAGRDVTSVLAPLETLIDAAGEERVGAARRGEIVFRRGDGMTATIGLSISTYVSELGGVHRVILFRDLSTVLALRRERDRLLQLAAVGDILPSVLHELRNPLAASISMLEVIVEDSEGALQSDLHALLWELRRMTLNLQAIGGMSRPLKTGGATCAVDHAVREACRVLAPTAESRGVTITCAVNDLPLLPIDRGILSGVVFNLVTNAIDACSRGKVVTVRASLSGDVFVLSVHDNGKGMKPEVLARCCELFFTEKDGGSGIGLALCKETATAAGGTLNVESAPGEGTTVTLRIPLDKK